MGRPSDRFPIRSLVSSGAARLDQTGVASVALPVVVLRGVDVDHGRHPLAADLAKSGLGF
jgi:hypothetical protein